MKIPRLLVNSIANKRIQSQKTNFSKPRRSNLNSGLMVTNMKVNLKMEKDRAMDCLFGLMEINIMVIGTII